MLNILYQNQIIRMESLASTIQWSSIRWNDVYHFFLEVFRFRYAVIVIHTSTRINTQIPKRISTLCQNVIS